MCTDSAIGRRVDCRYSSDILSWLGTSSYMQEGMRLDGSCWLCMSHARQSDTCVLLRCCSFEGRGGVGGTDERTRPSRYIEKFPFAC